MQTPAGTVRYMVAESGSKMAINSYSMRIFDHMTDAIAHAQSVKTDRVWVLSPTDAPKKINVAKWLKENT